jgi:hypothetical protein
MSDHGIGSEIYHLKNENNKLRAENEELRRDKERLDWILNTRPPHGVVIVKDKGCYPEKFNTREKLDAAMQTEKEKQ